MPDDGFIQVNFASLEMGAQSLAGAAGTLQTQMGDLESAMAPMLATWEGRAMEAFVPRKTTWHGAATEVHTQIMALKNAVDQAQELYTTNENVNTNLM